MLKYVPLCCPLALTGYREIRFTRQTTFLSWYFEIGCFLTIELRHHKTKTIDLKHTKSIRMMLVSLGYKLYVLVICPREQFTHLPELVWRQLAIMFEIQFIQPVIFFVAVFVLLVCEPVHGQFILSRAGVNCSQFNTYSECDGRKPSGANYMCFWYVCVHNV